MAKNRNLLLSLGLALVVTAGKGEYYEWQERRKLKKKLKKDIENLEEGDIIVIKLEV